MDFILNGKGSGAVADKLLECDFDVNCLRPFIGKDGKSYITRNHNGILEAAPANNVTATLRKDDWKVLDDAIVAVAKPRLKAVGDLRGAGLTYVIPNGMGKIVLETETVSDINPAEVNMDGITEAANDRPLFELGSLPLPIIHKNFHYSARQLAASRNGGSPLDTTTAELAARRVAEEAEKMLIGNSTEADSYSYGGGVIYGYTDFPSRISADVTDPTDSGWTGATFLDEVLGMMEDARAVYQYGPYILYTGTGWQRYLANDFKAGSDKSLRSRVLETDGLTDIRGLDYLSGFELILVQMSSDVVREVIGMDLTTVEWDSHGGLQKNFKVMAIMVPQLRADQDGNCGIVHATVPDD